MYIAVLYSNTLGSRCHKIILTECYIIFTVFVVFDRVVFTQFLMLLCIVLCSCMRGTF